MMEEFPSSDGSPSPNPYSPASPPEYAVHVVEDPASAALHGRYEPSKFYSDRFRVYARDPVDPANEVSKGEFAAAAADIVTKPSAVSSIKNSSAKSASASARPTSASARASSANAPGSPTEPKLCTLPPPKRPRIFDLTIFCFGLIHALITIGIALSWVFGTPQVFDHGVVVTDFYDCSKVGKDVLIGGGTAVDAAIASAFCMCVHYPHVASLGGGGFMLVHHHKHPEMSRVIDFRETAPARLTQKILDEGKIRSNTGSGFNGGVFVGVPGVVSALFDAHRKFGKMKWKELLEPAIGMAKNSRSLNDHLAAACNDRVHDRMWETEPASLINKLMQAAKKTVNFQNTELAETLEKIQKGPDGFYKGPVAEKIIKAVAKASGVMTKYDLQMYALRWQKPLNMTWGNFTILTAGPPSGGIASMLGLGYLMLNPDIHRSTFAAPDAMHLMMEANKKSLAEFAALGDPRFASYVKNRTDFLINPKTVENEARHIRKTHTLQPVETFPVLPESAATEILVADNDDLYVSLVFGLNSYFGSRVEAAGFFLNNAMGNFFPTPIGVAVPDPDTGANFLEPNKRPLTLAAPIMVVSSTHMCESRFISAAPSFDILTQVIASHFLFNKPIGDCLYEARLHLGTPFGTRDYLTELHEPYLSEVAIHSLESKGISFSILKAPYQSCHAIMKYGDKVDGQADPRTDSMAATF